LKVVIIMMGRGKEENKIEKRNEKKRQKYTRFFRTSSFLTTVGYAASCPDFIWKVPY
jgi:hypothetical protein